eukprot:gene27255-33947_t
MKSTDGSTNNPLAALSTDSKGSDVDESDLDHAESHNNVIKPMELEETITAEDAAFMKHKPHFLTFLNPYMESFAACVVPNSVHKTRPWLRATVPYMMTVGWVNFNTWGIIVAIMPFAISAVSPGNGSYNLAIAYELGAVLLVCGDMSTTLFRMPMFGGIVAFTAFCFTIYIAALGTPGYNTAAAAPILILIFSVERFIEAHLVTSAYRAIATEFPIADRQAASRAVGICDQVSTTVGAILSTLVVSLLFKCNASR